MDWSWSCCWCPPPAWGRWSRKKRKHVELCRSTSFWSMSSNQPDTESSLNGPVCNFHSFTQQPPPHRIPHPCVYEEKDWWNLKLLSLNTALILKLGLYPNLNPKTKSETAKCRMKLWQQNKIVSPWWFQTKICPHDHMMTRPHTQADGWVLFAQQNQELMLQPAAILTDVESTHWEDPHSQNPLCSLQLEPKPDFNLMLKQHQWESDPYTVSVWYLY